MEENVFTLYLGLPLFQMLTVNNLVWLSKFSSHLFPWIVCFCLILSLGITHKSSMIHYLGYRKGIHIPLESCHHEAQRRKKINKRLPVIGWRKVWVCLFKSSKRNQFTGMKSCWGKGWKDWCLIFNFKEICTTFLFLNKTVAALRALPGSFNWCKTDLKNSPHCLP